MRFGMKANRWLRSLVAFALAGWPGCRGDVPKPQPAPAAKSPERLEPADANPAPPVVAEFAGAAQCAQCHPAQHARWSGSHHDRAMQIPTPETVEGALHTARITHGSETVQLVRDAANAYVVRVRSNGTAPQTFPVRYTFGVDPLQQYLVDVGDGRLQALSMAWDSRPKAKGGQRWFHLHGDEPAPPGDRLHWRSAAYNWNAMCADCHSTGVQRGYDRDRDRYTTSYAEIDVSCEACHGPGSRHVAWARATAAGGVVASADKGLTVPLGKPASRRWVRAEDADIATLVGAPATDEVNDRELQTCAPCHSRRAELGPAAGDTNFHDRYRLALIEDPLYFADGQSRDEVFVYGSFLQSRMRSRGVVCSDCHDSHSLQLKAQGNALCATCHRPSRFDVPAHHLHAQGSEAAQCVTCHMPEATYMQVDARRDHRFGVPAPALSERVGSPDVCTGCHKDKDRRWAQGEIDRRRVGPARTRAPGDALWRAWQGQPHAEDDLLQLVRSREVAPIVRASALAELAAYPSPAVEDLVRTSCGDASPLVRRAAASAADALPPARRWAAIRALLDDPTRSVRMEAAGSLMDSPAAGESEATQQKLERAYNEWIGARVYNQDRAEALVDLADVARRGGDARRAEQLLRAAIEKDPSFSAGPLNLADLYRAAGDDARAIATLRAGLPRAGDRPMLEHALGLALIRTGDKLEALQHLQAAYRASPERVRLGYVYAIGLFDSGNAEAALEVLRALHQRRPGDVEVLAALVEYSGKAGHAEQATLYSRALQALVGPPPSN